MAALYRLDYLDPLEAVADWRGDVLTRHAATARAKAVEAAAAADRDVQVSRIGKAGAIRPAFIIGPDGRSRKPANTRAADGRDHSGAGTCFCAECRAERRAARGR
jgi:hypothetical protein